MHPLLSGISFSSKFYILIVTLKYPESELNGAK